MTRRVDFLQAQREPALGWVILSLGCLLTLTAVWVGRIEASLLREQEQRTAARLAEQRARTAAESRAKHRPMSEAEARARHELNWPWGSALRAVETAAAEPVFVLALALDPKAGSLKIEGEAEGSGEAMAFARALERDPALGSVLLASTRATAEPGTGRSVTKFVVTAKWGNP